MSETLKPCPLCGSAAVLDTVYVKVADTQYTTYDIRCDNESCECGVRDFNRESDATAAWNRRAPSPNGQDLEAGGWLDMCAEVTDLYREGMDYRPALARLRSRQEPEPVAWETSEPLNFSDTWVTYVSLGGVRVGYLGHTDIEVVERVRRALGASPVAPREEP